jgi:O-methyltransferase
MQNRKRESLNHPGSQGLRTRISDFVNQQLRRWGYALVRIDGNQTGRSSAVSESGYAYANLHVLDVYSPWNNDHEFLRIWQIASGNTLTDILRSYELYQCVREVAEIPGDILEVGVWRGGSGAVLAAGAHRWKSGATVWLCDTFAGVVKVGKFDPTYRGGEHADTSLNTVASLMSSLELTNTEVLKGVFPDETGTALLDGKIALCHIDVDVYQSAADVVSWVAPRLSTGSMLVFDDYGFSTCQGITRLVNELRLSGDWIYIYNLNKHAILIRR